MKKEGEKTLGRPLPHGFGEKGLVSSHFLFHSPFKFTSTTGPSNSSVKKVGITSAYNAGWNFPQLTSSPGKHNVDVHHLSRLPWPPAAADLREVCRLIGPDKPGLHPFRHRSTPILDLDLWYQGTVMLLEDLRLSSMMSPWVG